MTNTLSNNNTTTDVVSYNSGLITPVDIDNIPIIYEGNPAHIPGLLHELGGWVERTGNFKELIEHGAVLLPNAKVAFDSVNSVKFYRGTPTTATRTRCSTRARTRALVSTSSTPSPRSPRSRSSRVRGRDDGAATTAILVAKC